MFTQSDGGGCASRRYLSDEDSVDNNSFLPKDIRRDNSFPRKYPKSNLTEGREFEKPTRPSSSGSLRGEEHLRNFSPCAPESGQDILNRLKNELRKESDMFFHSNPECDYDMHSRKVDDGDDWFHKGFDDMRSRHPMFRMPNWMTEDNDVSNLASRMSHSPHFSSLGRRGAPWRERERERRSSGGSPMSGNSEGDCTDGHYHNSGAGTAVRIPIRIEAEAPPGYEPISSQHSQQPEHCHQQDDSHLPKSEPQASMGNLKKQPQYASKTTSAVDTLKQEEIPRNTRCSSAPPDMAEQLSGPQRFISKTTISPQSPIEKQLSTSPVFNNVAKPFVSPHRSQETTPLESQDSLENSKKQSQDMHHYPQQRTDTQRGQQFPPHQYHSQQQFSPQQENQQPYSQHSHPHQSHQNHPQQPQYSQSFDQQHHPGYQHQQRESPSYKSGVVRNIPIIFEGRDGAKAKDASATSRSPQSTHESHQQQPTRPPREKQFFNSPFGYNSSHSFPNEDSFFGFPPSHHPAPSHHYEQSHSQQPPQQQFSHHQQKQFPSQPQQSHPQHQAHPQHQTHPQHQAHPQPSQPFQKEMTPPPAAQPQDVKMEKIASVRKFFSELQEKVKNFEGKGKNKEFLFLDEMLTRALLQLDDIDPDGRDDVRQTRKMLIKDINNTISTLEKKATQSSPESKPTEGTSAASEKLENTEAMQGISCSNAGDVERPQECPTQSPKPEEMATEQKRTETSTYQSVEEIPMKNNPESLNSDKQSTSQRPDAMEVDSQNINADTSSAEAKPVSEESENMNVDTPSGGDNPAKENSENMNVDSSSGEAKPPVEESVNMNIDTPSGNTETSLANSNPIT